MRVAILASENTALFELSCAVELFGLPRPEFDNWYQADVVSFAAESVAATAGVTVRGKQIDSLDAYDMLVIPNWSVKHPKPDEHIESAIQSFYQSGKRILSFCSGAFLLAELGFLDGRQATTHWMHAEKFKARFPQVQYVDNVLYLYDGHIGCSAGSASGLDLGLEVIRYDYGYKIANQVARRLVISAHRQGGQSQFVETPMQQHSNQFATALDWALCHLAEPIGIQQLADQAKMSRRTFDRKFRRALNITPKEWLTNQRLKIARDLLESEPYALEKIAALSGFDNAITMRHHFKRIMGISPKDYREQFNSQSTIIAQI